jgi:hypothetical protein
MFGQQKSSSTKPCLQLPCRVRSCCCDATPSAHIEPMCCKQAHVEQHPPFPCRSSNLMVAAPAAASAGTLPTSMLPGSTSSCRPDPAPAAGAPHETRASSLPVRLFQPSHRTESLGRPWGYQQFAREIKGKRRHALQLQGSVPVRSGGTQVPAHAQREGEGIGSEAAQSYSPRPAHSPQVHPAGWRTGTVQTAQSAGRAQAGTPAGCLPALLKPPPSCL